MIKPTRYLNLQTCILHISSKILEVLLDIKVAPLQELEIIVMKELGSDAKFNFIETLNFLFLVGKIDYHLESDSVFIKEYYSELFNSTTATTRLKGNY